MPDPDPHPPQPRPVSAARWLLMLVPSVPIIISPFLADAWGRSHDLKLSDDLIGTAIGMLLSTLCAALVFSLVISFLLEKWRHGTVESFSRAIYYGLLIFSANLFIAFAGCAVGAAIPHP